MSDSNEHREEEAQAGPTIGPPLNIGEAILHAVARFPLTIVVLTFLGTAGGLVFGLSQPNLYTSVGRLMVLLGQRELEAADTEVGQNQPARGTIVALGDVMAIFTDLDLHRRVVEEVGATRILQPYDPAAADDEGTSQLIRQMHALQAWLMGYEKPAPSNPDAPVGEKTIAGAVEVVAAGMRIYQPSRTSTIEVSFTAHDPELAQLVASTYLDVFQKRHREIFDLANKRAWITEQLELAKEAERSARSALQKRHEDDGIHDLDAVRDGLANETQTLRSQNDQDAILSKTLEREFEALTVQLEEHEPPVSATGQVNVASPTTSVLRVQSLVTDLSRLRGELATLSAEYVETGSYFKQERKRLEAEIEKTNGLLEEIGEQEQATTAVVRQETDSVLADLVSQCLTNVREREKLKAGLDERTKLLAAREKQLAELVQLEPIYMDLESAVAETSLKASEFATEYRRYEIWEQLDKDLQMSNLKVTVRPALPTSKIGPERAKFLGMGIIGGLFAGLALATLRQILDFRLRYPKNVEAALGIRVLGVVPEQRRWRRRGRRLKRRLQRAMAKQ